MKKKKILKPVSKSIIAEVDALVAKTNSFSGQQKLKKARRISATPKAEGRDLLICLHRAPASVRDAKQALNLKLLAQVVNMAITERMGSFMLSEKIFNEEILKVKVDSFDGATPTARRQRKSISGAEFSAFIAYTLDKEAMEKVFTPEIGSRKAAVFSLIYKPALAILKDLMGEAGIEQQRKRVIEYAANSTGDTDSELFSPVLSTITPITCKTPTTSETCKTNITTITDKDLHLPSVEAKKVARRSRSDKWSFLLFQVLREVDPEVFLEGATDQKRIPLIRPIWMEIRNELEARLRNTQERFHLPFSEAAYCSVICEGGVSIVSDINELLDLMTNEYYEALITYHEELISAPGRSVSAKCSSAVGMAQYFGVAPLDAFSGVTEAHFEQLKQGRQARNLRKDSVTFVGEWDPSVALAYNENAAKYGHIQGVFLSTLTAMAERYGKVFRAKYWEMLPYFEQVGEIPDHSEESA